ncbi:MAG: methionyl-tRNA formyltransferase [Phycisphaerae bacterium]
MRIFFCGSGSFGIPCLEALRLSEHEIVHIVTQPAHKAGRGRKLRPTDVAQWAQEHNVPYSEFANINSDESMELARSLKPDLFVVIAFGQKISQDFISIATHEAINVHGSLLPAYRGAAPINWAIINGEDHTGVTIITLAERMDAGLMLGKSRIPILSDDNASTVHDKLANISAPLLLETIDKIADGTVIHEVQDESEVTIARKLKKSDGVIDWTESAKRIANKVRGFWPWPEAQTWYRAGCTGKVIRVIIAAAEAVERCGGGAAGSFDENMNVVCGSGALKIHFLKPDNSHLMDFKSFENGRCGGPDDLFLSSEPAL